MGMYDIIAQSIYCLNRIVSRYHDKIGRVKIYSYAF